MALYTRFSQKIEKSLHFRRFFLTDSKKIVYNLPVNRQITPNQHTIMIIKTELYDLADFDAWSGAVETKERICDADKGDEFMEQLEECYPDGMTDSKLNDLLWFEEEWCYELVGLNSHGVEPADAGEVASWLESDIEEIVDQYNNEHGTEYTADELGVSYDDFESSIEEWLDENQGCETDESQLSNNWLNDGGYDEIWVAIKEAAENLSEE